MTQGEYDQFLKFREGVEADVRDTKYEGKRNYQNVINSFDIGFMNNGVKPIKIDLSNMNDDQKRAILESIRRWRNIVGNNLLDMIRAYDERDYFTESVSPKMISDFQKEMFDEIFKEVRDATTGKTRREYQPSLNMKAGTTSWEKIEEFRKRINRRRKFVDPDV